MLRRGKDKEKNKDKDKEKNKNKSKDYAEEEVEVPGGFLVAEKVTSGLEADKAGVREGDYIIGLGNERSKITMDTLAKAIRYVQCASAISFWVRVWR